MYRKFEKLLESHGVTAYRVAHATGISTSTFSGWKNGRSSPKLDKLKRIADYFGVSISYFVEEENGD
ncbi:helix-turn-helix domain-containing protein [Beduinella massiliensis]|uniref:helix-turn-helix domain-containing protein n=1 Tax=Beduinella massiliensis TaxID=1852363 RepID=UPI000C855588